ncbi:DUF58 domain-containing protein [Akkermansiaceae bacterium]|nr:DUF58 domain-containing protein [Akkermansiaceae bacterium]MDB4393003.1 DUF58 domain-containing protein [Akkermansiaceae bacterium]MDC0286971.1 DUF58 domain-containing protein [Akkermansiaceae bacterium]
MKYDFLDTDVLARLKAIPMESRFPMIGNVAGRHRSPHRGSSVEFAEYRKYVPGDDTRRLDWKAYARSDRYYIKEFEADTNLRAYFVVDSSGSMGFSSGENPSKMEFARRIAATLSYLIVNQGDSAGLSCCNEKLHLEIPPSRRPAQLQHIFESLASVEPKGETGLIEALHTVAEKIQQRALVIVLSDFFVESDELAATLQHLRFRKHDIAMFHLLDPQEVAFHFERPHRFVDLEEGTAVVAEPNLIVDEYHAALNEFLEATEKGSYDVNADYQLLQTDANIEEVVSNFVTGRLTKKS